MSFIILERDYLLSLNIYKTENTFPAGFGQFTPFNLNYETDNP